VPKRLLILPPLAGEAAPKAAAGGPYEVFAPDPTPPAFANASADDRPLAEKG
jgi:hypothetical protein